MNLEDLLDSAVNIVFTGRLRMEHFDRKSPTGNGICWSISVECGELVSSLNRVSAMWKISDLTFSAFMVADVTMSFRSRRRERTDGLLISECYYKK